MKFEIIKRNLSWEEAKDELCQGLFLSHDKCPNEWITITDTGNILDFNGEYHDYDEWWYLRRGGQWDNGFILMKLK